MYYFDFTIAIFITIFSIYIDAYKINITIFGIMFSIWHDFENKKLAFEINNFLPLADLINLQLSIHPIINILNIFLFRDEGQIEIFKYYIYSYIK